MEQIKIMSFPEKEDKFVEVPVNNGSLHVKVSPEDYYRVVGKEWITTRTGEVMMKSTRMYMRRFIGGTKVAIVNGDKLDLRRENLRINF
jgi:hypothetical protein